MSVQLHIHCHSYPSPSFSAQLTYFLITSSHNIQSDESLSRSSAEIIKDGHRRSDTNAHFHRSERALLCNTSTWEGWLLIEGFLFCIRHCNTCWRCTSWHLIIHAHFCVLHSVHPFEWFMKKTRAHSSLETQAGLHEEKEGKSSQKLESPVLHPSMWLYRSLYSTHHKRWDHQSLPGRHSSNQEMVQQQHSHTSIDVHNDGSVC